MHENHLLWLIWVPYMLGVASVAGVGFFHIQWNLKQLRTISLKVTIPTSVRIKAAAPLLISLILFSFLHLTWVHYLPWLSKITVKAAYDSDLSDTVGHSLVHIIGGIVTYMMSDGLFRRLVRSPFPRLNTTNDPTRVELSDYVLLSQCLPPNEHIGN